MKRETFEYLSYDDDDDDDDDEYSNVPKKSARAPSPGIYSLHAWIGVAVRLIGWQFLASHKDLWSCRYNFIDTNNV